MDTLHEPALRWGHEVSQSAAPIRPLPHPSFDRCYMYREELCLTASPLVHAICGVESGLKLYVTHTELIELVRVDGIDFTARTWRRRLEDAASDKWDSKLGERANELTCHCTHARTHAPTTHAWVHTINPPFTQLCHLVLCLPLNLTIHHPAQLHLNGGATRISFFPPHANAPTWHGSTSRPLISRSCLACLERVIFVRPCKQHCASITPHARRCVRWV